VRVGGDELASTDDAALEATEDVPNASRFRWRATARRYEHLDGLAEIAEAIRRA
jgi:hypothetical protein